MFHERGCSLMSGTDLQTLLPLMTLFQNPSAAYRSLPFWSWNCRVTRELIDAQLPIFKEMGFGGVTIHPRTGLDIPYLGDEYLDLVDDTIRRCEKLGLRCWMETVSTASEPSTTRTPAIAGTGRTPTARPGGTGQTTIVCARLASCPRLRFREKAAERI